MMKSRFILSIALLFAVVTMADAAQSPRVRPSRQPGRRTRPVAAETQQQAATQAQVAPTDRAAATQAAYEYVFKDAVKLDPAKVKEVAASKPGTRFWYDTNNDGKIDEVWFIDIDPRHNAKNRPLLVRAIDEDGDMKKGDEPDKDSDLYVADWHADGVVDVVLDYQDDDKDNDLDQMGIFNGSPNSLHVWYSRDDGDDNLLWWDQDYNYYQVPVQSYTHFGGDESFYALAIKVGEDHWTATYENPFLFWDNNKDGTTDEVVRYHDNGTIRSVRWSFDADNDATMKSPRDYDVSMSAYGPGWNIKDNQRSVFTLAFPDSYSKPIEIRGFKTGRFMDRDKAREYASTITFAGGMYTWDEDDNNVANAVPVNKGQLDAGERWEGILNHAYNVKGQLVFPAIGGPSCSQFNKRFEFVKSPKSTFEYYFSPADKRIHVKSEDTGWIEVDYNYDNQPDMRYEWFDTDSNGIVDKLQLDVNGDGEVEDFWKLDESGVTPVAWNFEAVNKAIAPIVKEEPARVYALNQALAAALEKGKAGSGQDVVWSLIENKMDCEGTSGGLAAKLLSSDESMLYFMRLAADRRIAALKDQASNDEFSAALDAARAKGDTDGMTKIVRKQFGVNGSKTTYAKWIAELRKPPETQRVAWDDTWLPPNVGWESETEAAYRMYFGHWDCFGKSRDVLCYPILTQPKRGGGGSYHHEQDWGMDMLHIGNTCGLGGLTLWINGKPYPVYKAEDQTTGPLFTWHKGPVEPMTKTKVVMECTVTNVGPEENPYTVRFRPMSLAGRPDSPIEVKITGGKKGDKVEVGVGLGGRKFNNEEFLIDEKAGTMIMRGFQDPEIGWVGIGVAFPASRFVRLEHKPPFEHYAVLKYKVGETFTYSIRADWVRGHRFPVFPSAEDWMDMMRDTAKIAKY